jgi:hypothetical protein
MTHKSEKSPSKREKHQKGIENQTTNERVREWKKYKQNGGLLNFYRWDHGGNCAGNVIGGPRRSAADCSARACRASHL